jgi:hypothetical protein
MMVVGSSADGYDARVWTGGSALTNEAVRLRELIGRAR